MSLNDIIDSLTDMLVNMKLSATEYIAVNEAIRRLRSMEDDLK